MKLKIRYIYFMVGFASFMGCKTRRTVENVNVEFAAIKFSEDLRFEYFYYNSTFMNIEHTYCRGRFTHSGKNYQLFPDSIEPNNLKIRCQANKETDIQKGIKLKIETDINDGSLDLAKYKITAFNDSVNCVFNGVNVDTVLKNVNLRDFRIKVELRHDYLEILPKPTFASIITEKINVPESSNSLFIKIPVSVNLFYYQYNNEINVEDDRKYWIINDKKVLKKGNYPF